MNIIYNEKRFPSINEVCAVNLSAIKGTSLVFEDDYLEKNIPRFYYSDLSFNDSESITLVRYSGKGVFEDLLTGEKMRAGLFYADQIGTNEYQKLDLDSQVELEQISDRYTSVVNSDTYEEFLKNYRICTVAPLVLSIEDATFKSLNNELLKLYTSQQLDFISDSIMQNKKSILNNLYNGFDDNIKKAKSYYEWLDVIKRR